MGNNPASAFYYPGLLFDFSENCGEATHVTNKWKKQVASLEKLSNLPHSIHPSKKLLFCLIALTIYFAAQTELSARVPTYRTNLHACQIDQREMEGLMLKAFYFRYSMFM